MSCLKLHWPQSLSVYPRVDAEWQDDANDGNSSDGDDAPVILSFPRIRGSVAGQIGIGRIGPNRQRELLTRARIIHENRYCAECGRAAVVPVDAEPARLPRFDAGPRLGNAGRLPATAAGTVASVGESDFGFRFGFEKTGLFCAASTNTNPSAADVNTSLAGAFGLVRPAGSQLKDTAPVSGQSWVHRRGVGGARWNSRMYACSPNRDCTRLRLAAKRRTSEIPYPKSSSLSVWGQLL